METATIKTETETAKSDKSPEAAKVMAAKARAEKAHANAEAFHAKTLALIREGKELDADTLDALAGIVGTTASDKGYPTESAYLAISAAVAHRTLSYERRADLARKANAKCKDNGKPVAKVTSKARSDKGAQTFEFNKPQMLAANVGAE